MFHSHCFDFSVWEMYGALLYGGKLVMVSQEDARDPFRYMELLKEHKVTVLNQTPTAFDSLKTACTQEDTILSDLRYVVFGGEALTPLKLKDWYANHPDVKLVEKKNGKRLLLFAKNTSSTPYMAFLRVSTDDYRRTSKRPILKEIPGNTQVLLKTMILLEGKTGEYDATFIINEVTTNLSIRKSKEFDLKISAAKIDKNVIIFTDTNCNLCVEGLKILKENAFSYEDFNLEINDLALQLLHPEIGDS